MTDFAYLYKIHDIKPLINLNNRPILVVFFLAASALVQMTWYVTNIFFNKFFVQHIYWSLNIELVRTLNTCDQYFRSEHQKLQFISLFHEILALIKVMTIEKEQLSSKVYNITNCFCWKSIFKEILIQCFTSNCSL